VRGTSNTILSSFVDQYHLQISGDDLVFKKCRAYVLALCCLASPAKAAGIQLLNSDPGLLGAIWYPCTAEPEDVPLGDLAASPEIRLTGVKDCPVRGEKLPLVIFSHGRGGWFTMHHDTAEALADAGFVVAAINHPGDNGKDSFSGELLGTTASGTTLKFLAVAAFQSGPWRVSRRAAELAYSSPQTIRHHVNDPGVVPGSDTCRSTW